MVTALLVVIYIAFIGLGLPHSLFGAAWPAIQTDFNVSIDSANYITMLITGCTVIASIFGARLVNRYGTRTVVMVSASMAAVALFGFSVSGNLWVMCLFAIPLGLSSGATDAALNNYIALHYSAMHLNFMHCFYGVGIMASPYIMSLILESSGWRVGYQAILGIQLVIVVVILATLPLWKKVRHAKKETKEEVTPKNLSYIDMVKTSEIRLDWLMCIAVNAIEGVVGTWGAYYLIHAHAFTEAKAAGLVTLFYIGLASGRFLSGLLSTKISSWNLIKFSIAVMVAGTVIMFVTKPTFAMVGLFLVGLGNGPVYPNIMHLTPRHFGEEHSASVLGYQMASAYFGFLIGPPIFGYLAKQINASVLPAYIMVWNALLILAVILFLRKFKKQNKNIQ